MQVAIACAVIHLEPERCVVVSVDVSWRSVAEPTGVDVVPGHSFGQIGATDVHCVELQCPLVCPGEPGDLHRAQRLGLDVRVTEVVEPEIILIVFVGFHLTMTTHGSVICPSHRHRDRTDGGQFPIRNGVGEGVVALEVVVRPVGEAGFVACDGDSAVGRVDPVPSGHTIRCAHPDQPEGWIGVLIRVRVVGQHVNGHRRHVLVDADSVRLRQRGLVDVAHTDADIQPARGTIDRCLQRHHIIVVLVEVRWPLVVGRLPEAQDAVVGIDREMLAVDPRQTPAGALPIDHVSGYIVRTVLGVTRRC